jgi:hypothetical protein
MSDRMRRQDATSKPRVYRFVRGGAWWTDVVIAGTYHCHISKTHAEAIEKAHEYARMAKA